RTRRMSKGRGLRFGLVVALGVVLHAALTEWAWRPLHAEGAAQSLLGPLIGLDDLVQFPGKTVASALRLRGGTAWLVAVALNAGSLALLAGWLRGRPATRRAPDPPIPSRRAILIVGSRIVLGGAAAAVGYGLTAGPRWFGVTRRELSLRGLP